MNKIRYLKKIISKNGYFQSRMLRMDRESTFYLECAQCSKNKALRAAYAKQAEMYNKRYNYYFNHELRKSI